MAKVSDIDKRPASPVLPADSAAKIGGLFKAIGSDGFYPRLTDFLRDFVEFDDIVILRFRATGPPSPSYAVLGEADRESYVAYVQGLYQQSPFYEICKKGESGFEALRDIAPDDFWESEYYHSCMSGSRLVDEASFMLQRKDGVSYLVTLGRTDDLPLFTSSEKQALKSLSPIVEQSVLRHEALLGNAEDGSEIDTAPVLDAITPDSLTQREREIISYLIRGYSSKACARELDISPATERVHRKNIYEKLGVSSQSELLASVFDSLLEMAARTATEPSR